MRLIDADALKDMIRSVVDGPWDLWPLNIIDNAPTVEYPFYAEAYQTGYEEAKKELERPQVEWIVDENDDFNFKKCSNCGEGAEWLDGGSQFLSNFCPNCGAKMNTTNNQNTESEGKNMKEMTVEQYRQRMIEAFRNAECDELIALVCPPNENDFKAMESLLRNFWKREEVNEDDR